MGSLIFYIFNFGISTFFITLANNSKRKSSTIIYTIVGLTIPILIFSLRYNVGSDYLSYINLYNTYANRTIEDMIFSRGFEPLFAIIMKISWLLENAQLMFIIFSILNIIVMFKVLSDNKEKVPISIAFFLILFMYSSTMASIIRQSMAVAIVAYSYKYILNRNIKKFIICILVASMFHSTALLFMPFYFINYKDNTRKQKVLRILIVIVVGGIVAFYNQFLGLLTQNATFEKYISYGNIIESNNYTFFIKLSLLIVITIFKRRLYNYNEKNKLYYLFLIIDVLLYATGFISPFVKRIALYFQMSEVFIISQLPKLVNEQKSKNLIILGIICYAIGLFVISSYVLGQSNMIPYQTILGKEI